MKLNLINFTTVSKQPQNSALPSIQVRPHHKQQWLTYLIPLLVKHEHLWYNIYINWQIKAAENATPVAEITKFNNDFKNQVLSESLEIAR